VTRLRRGGIFNDCFVANFQDSESERLLKIDRHLMKLCLKYRRLFFSGHDVYTTVLWCLDWSLAVFRRTDVPGMMRVSCVMSPGRECKSSHASRM